jgi:hypothetical protein
MGAGGDIFRATTDGEETPFHAACNCGHDLAVCEWLIQKGALNDPDSPGQHITQAIVKRDVGNSDLRPGLLAWAQGVVAASDIFRNTVLMGTFSPNTTTTAAAAAAAAAIPTTPPSPLSKLSGQTYALELVADFLGGVSRGRELRNARELAECLVAMDFVIPKEWSSFLTDEEIDLVVNQSHVPCTREQAFAALLMWDGDVPNAIGEIMHPSGYGSS